MAVVPWKNHNQPQEYQTQGFEEQPADTTRINASMMMMSCLFVSLCYDVVSFVPLIISYDSIEWVLYS